MATFNGKKVDVINAEITYDVDYNWPRGLSLGDIVVAKTNQRVVIEGILSPESFDTTKNMCYDDQKQDSLSKRLKDAGLSDNEKLLRKHGVVNQDGTLTEEGKDLLLNILFEEKEDEVIDGLRAIEDVEEED